MRDQNAESDRLLKVLVVDDEDLARERLKRILDGIEGVTCAGEAENGRVALARIVSLLPDVLLLDIEMPGLNGLELAATPGIPPIIFTTAHVQFAPDAFDLDAVDFLPKPVRRERLVRALDRARRRIGALPANPSRTPPRRIAVHEAGAIRFVDPTSVVAFHARDKYTEFTLDGRELLVRESLDALAARLGELGFVRVHRSSLVRRDAIRQLEQRDGVLVARLADGTLVEVSRRSAPAVRRALGVRK